MNFLDLIGPSLAAGAKMAKKPKQAMTPPSVSDIQLREDDVLNRLQPPQQAQGMSGRDVLPVAGLAILASLLGAKNRDINQGFSAFQGIRNQQAEQKNQQANQGYEQNRQRAQVELGRLDDERKGRMREFEFQRGVELEDARDTRNFNQTRTLQREDDERGAVQRELDRKARIEAAKNSQGGKALLSFVSSAEKTIKDLPNEPDRLEGLSLLYRHRDAQFGEGDPLTPEETVRLREIMSKQTMTGQGKEIKNASEKKKFDFLDRNLQVDYDNKVATLGLKNLSSKLKEKDLQYYDDNQKFKRLMIELAIGREGRQIQNDELRNFLSVNKEVFDQTSFRVKALDDKIAELDKELPGVMSLPPQEAIKRGMEIEMMKQKLVQERKALLDSIPDIGSNPYAPANPMGGEFATGPIGNAGRGTRPVTTAPKAARTVQPVKANTQGPNSTKAKADAMKKKYGR